jgi:hypothetical protein
VRLERRDRVTMLGPAGREVVVLLLGAFVSVSVSTLNSGGDTVVIRVVMS